MTLALVFSSEVSRSRRVSCLQITRSIGKLTIEKSRERSRARLAKISQVVQDLRKIPSKKPDTMAGLVGIGGGGEI